MPEASNENDDQKSRDMIESLLSLGAGGDDSAAAEDAASMEDDLQSQDMIENLFAAAEPEKPKPPVAPVPTVAAATEPTEAALEKPAIADPKSLKKPKIDLAALRKAKEARDSTSQASVSRLFGEDEPPAVTVAPAPREPRESPAPPAVATKPPSIREQTPPAPVISPPTYKVKRRSFAEITDELTETLLATHPGLLKLFGMLGVFLAINAIVLVMLAWIGWI